jgi:hypothetical protein
LRWCIQAQCLAVDRCRDGAAGGYASSAATDTVGAIVECHAATGARRCRRERNRQAIAGTGCCTAEVGQVECRVAVAVVAGRVRCRRRELQCAARHASIQSAHCADVNTAGVECIAAALTSRVGARRVEADRLDRLVGSANAERGARRVRRLAESNIVAGGKNNLVADGAVAADTCREGRRAATATDDTDTLAILAQLTLYTQLRPFRINITGNFKGY